MLFTSNYEIYIFEFIAPSLKLEILISTAIEVRGNVE
jgi:hypothetical protein